MELGPHCATLAASDRLRVLVEELRWSGPKGRHRKKPPLLVSSQLERSGPIHLGWLDEHDSCIHDHRRPHNTPPHTVTHQVGTRVTLSLETFNAMSAKGQGGMHHHGLMRGSRTAVRPDVPGLQPRSVPGLPDSPPRYRKRNLRNSPWRLYR